MKYKFVLLIVLFPVLASAQRVPNIDSLVNNVLVELKASWTLGVDSNSNTVDIGMYNKYKKLFDINATVDDDLNIQYIPGKGKGNYSINPIPGEFDVYAHDVALQVSKFRIDSVTSEEKFFFNEAMIYEIKRMIFIEKPAKYVLKDALALATNILGGHKDITFANRDSKYHKIAENEIIERLIENIRKNPDSLYQFNITSTMRITLAYAKDPDSTVKIMSIKNTSNTLTCVNDDDGDGVLNRADNLPAKFGEFTANGAPDDDLDEVPDLEDKCGGTYGSVNNKGCPQSYFITHKQLAGFVGAQYNNQKINLPALNKLGYQDAGFDATDVLQSKKGSIKNSGAVLGIYAGANFVYYPGKNAKRTGLSVGFTYSRAVAGFKLTEPAVYTYKSNDGYDPYRRQITINSLTEQIAYNIFNIPVQLSYRFKPLTNDKWVINVKAGPSLMLLNATTNYNATIDFGGIYQIDTISRGAIVYYNFFNAGSSWNVYVTSAGINNQNTNPGAASIFSQLNTSSQNFDFAENKKYIGQKKLSRTTVAFNFSFDGQYKGKKDNPMAITFGIHAVYAPLFEQKQKYKPIERTTDEFNSIFNSSARSTYFNYGLNLGLVYDF